MPKDRKAAGAAKAEQTGEFIYSFLTVLLAEIILVSLLRVLGKYYAYVQYMVPIKATAGWVALIGALLSIAALVDCCVTGKKTLGWICGGLTLLAACCGCIYLLYLDGVTLSYALIVGAGVLYVADQLYPREMQTLIGLTGLAAICYYVISQYSGKHVWNTYTAPFTIALAACLTATLLLTVLAGHNDGVVTIGKAQLRIWSRRNAALLLYLVCVVMAALLVLTFLLGATFAWYCVMVAAIVIFALIVLYTIKLM